MRTNTWLVALILAAAGSWAGCGSSESPGDNGPADVPADVADVPGDPGTADADVPEPRDVPTTETTGDEAPADVIQDEGPEIDWDALPSLPKDKTFTTTYAAGVGRGDVSPDVPTHLGGFGFCMGDETLCRSTDGVHDPLLASAVALADPKSGEVVMFIGVDTIGILRSDVEWLHHAIQMAIYEKYGVHFPGERAMIGASHAHSSCDTVGLWGPMFGAGRQEEYLDIMRKGIVKAAVDAYGDLQDVTMDWGTGTWANSDEDVYADDKDLFIVRGKKAGGDPLFTLVRYVSHPTTYGDKMHAASADWVGTMRKKLEAEVGGLNVLMNGPIGSLYPDRPSTCGLTEEAFPQGDRTTTDMDPADYMKTTCTGYGIADVAIAGLATAKPVADTGITFKHTKFEFHPTNGTLMMLAEVGPLPFDMVDVDDPTAMMYSIFSVATVGDLTYITTPGESFPSFGQEAKDIAIEAGLTNPIVLGLTQDWMGYLLLKVQWQDSNLSYHQSLSPGPDVEPAYMAALRTLLGLPAAP